MNQNQEYYGNTAYDFDMFVTKPSRRPAEIVDYPSSETRKKVHTQRKVRALAAKIAVGAMIFSIVAGVFANVFVRAEISQVEMQITKQEKEIATLDSEIVRLQCNLQDKLSYEALEKGAAALGMQKLERRQITYVQMAESGKENPPAED